MQGMCSSLTARSWSLVELPWTGPLHFVGSLVPTQHEDLMAIQREQMRRAKSGQGSGRRVSVRLSTRLTAAREG